MKHWEISQRNRALALGALVYAMLRAGVPAEVGGNWLQHAWPGLDAVYGPQGQRLIQSVLEGVGLASLIFGFELAFLAWSSRSLLGQWVYNSSSGTWGHARISIDIGKGLLNYEVDLYQSEADLCHTLASGEQRGFSGHGTTLLALQDGDRTRIWYHVEEFKTSKDFYPRREGILTLQSTLQKHELQASWARVGSLAPHLVPGQAAGEASSINAHDAAHASGTFQFFIPRRVFLARQGKAR